MNYTPPASFTVGSNGYFKQSILAYNGRDTQIPAMNGSLALLTSDTYSSNTKRNMVQSILCSNATNYDLSTSLALGTMPALGGTSNDGVKFVDSISLSSYGFHTKNKEFKHSLILGSGTTNDTALYYCTDTVKANLKY